MSTRPILDTFKDADGIPVQPYFAAFMLEKGIDRLTVPQPERANRNVEFIDWMDGRWRELEARLGFSWNQRTQHTNDMLDWLEERAVDHVARNTVEAA